MLRSSNVAPFAGTGKAQSLEELLDEMCKYGKPRLSRTDAAWVCTCEMHVASEGATFEVRSTFKEPTALIAAQVCMQRIKETLSKYGVAT